MKKLFLIAALTLGAMTASAHADAVKFRLCTGNSQLNYFKAGHMVKAKFPGVEVIETKGSLDNLDKVTAGECDGAFVQSDAMLVYSNRNAKAISSLERAGVLYQEQAHMICNRKLDLGRMVNLTKDMTVAIGPDGSGAHTTWDAFVLADKARYGKVVTDNRSGIRAVQAVADGSQVQCALVITALNSAFMKNDAQNAGDRVVLVGTDDRDMTTVAKDARGQYVYSYGEIPAGTYPRIQPSGAVYGTKAIGTIQVDAIFVANANWINDHEREYDGLLRAFQSAKPEISKLAQPQ
ncbi:TRAP transporter substrate-binding protein [Bradyrhizobium hipponense]|uniref:TRAP transporter substrate-binding protein n=1 Tax=Bradyrhizobium hipponense TaxID=2605638 RepID=A0A5S4YM15_9BRAD|nr:TAXI family TRAP transporter solute-binding subunit [Bradyrhizobium hipponense]TYO65410.1 TRAP transporter substrate-binding protein [Bradyrhizobium hipponense]